MILHTLLHLLPSNTTLKIYKMRYSNCLLSALLFIACSSRSYAGGSIFSQDSLPGRAESAQKTEKKYPSGTPYRKNSLKINISSLWLNNYSFTYERMLARKISFVAGYRFMPTRILANVSAIKNVIDQVASDGDDVKTDINKISASNNAFTGEFRFYAGRKPGARGFYVSLYGRYSKLDIDYPYDYQTDAKTYTVPLKASTTMWGAGLMIGAQWLIAKRVTLDWYIMGGHYGTIKGNATGATNLSDMPDQDRQFLKSDIEGLFTAGNKQYITATVTDQGVQAKISGPMIGIRGAGINLGIAF